jgi:hypothetical protein
MKQKPSRSAALAVLAMLAIVAAYGQARSEELPISPSSSDVAAQLKQAEQPSIALGVPNGGNGNTSKAVPSRGATDRDGSVRIGESSIGIKTDKSLRVIEPYKENDCANDDDCSDYSGLPKSAPARRTLKNVRKPFFGLSISRPIEW